MAYCPESTASACASRDSQFCEEGHCQYAQEHDRFDFPCSLTWRQFYSAAIPERRRPAMVPGPAPQGRPNIFKIFVPASPAPAKPTELKGIDL